MEEQLVYVHEVWIWKGKGMGPDESPWRLFVHACCWPLSVRLFETWPCFFVMD
jgi:hypothetical protein